MSRFLLLPLLVSPFHALADVVQLPITQTALSESETCPHPHISCPSSTPSSVDTCCLNYPSGHFLLTQFWDTAPALGPTDSWTIHGLWPDLCHGGFEQFCDSSRSHSDIRSILSSAGPSALLDFMSQYWLSLNGDNNHLWSHEWNKHGTCISTLKPACYPATSKDDEDFHPDVLDYFTHAATLFSTLNTYDALAASNIIPTYQRAYNLEDLQSAISTLQGAEVTFRCHGQELQEIWYHFTTHGPLRSPSTFTNETLTSSSTIAATKHKFRAVDPDGSKTNCPATGIRYLPKQSNQPQPTHTSGTSTTTSSPTSTSVPFSGKGHLLVRPKSTPSSSRSASSVKGCLIRSGAWYLTTGSSCANYVAKSDPKHLSLSDPFDPFFSTAPIGRDRKTDDDHRSSLPSDASDTSQDGSKHPFSDEDLPDDEIYIQPVRPGTDNGNSDEHLFTLSSLYAPCAVIPSIFPSGGGLFICQKNLGIQSIFSSVCDTDEEEDSGARTSPFSSSSSSKDCKSGKYKLVHMDKTVFYADKVPDKLEKVGIYADDKDGEREVELEIIWEAV